MVKKKVNIIAKLQKCGYEFQELRETVMSRSKI